MEELRERIEVKFFRDNTGFRIIAKDDLKCFRFKNERLIYNLIEGFRVKKLMSKLDCNSSVISKRLKRSVSTVRKQINMTTLAPDIVEAILEGRQPVDLSIKSFMKEAVPNDWDEQRVKYGF